jgi:cell wall-associated NlpC family hydrolase
MKWIIQRTVLVGLLTGLPWTLLADRHEADSGGSAAGDASPTAARIHHHHHAKASPTISPTPDPASGEAASEENVTPARKSRKNHHPVETEDAAEPSPTADAPDGMAPSTRNPRPSIAQDASLDTTQLKDFSVQPKNVQSLIETALDLTRQNLAYVYSSADPTNGGMDCSGFVYYVLTQAGLHDVPRDASGQYAWVRKADRFRAVISRRLDGFELDELKPGDLLFWSNTYKTDRDPPVTHTMIYLGREKSTGNRVMVGSSDGRTYRGLQRWGVSVFDLKPVSASSPSPGGAAPRFIGYGSIPGL